MFFEWSLTILGTSKLKKIIQNYTDTHLKSISIGTIATVITQNSWIISLIALGFAWVGVITLGSAIGLIAWANVGTTVQWLVIAFLGFSYDIKDFVLPFLAIGGMGYVFSTNKNRKYFFQLLFGFGCMFLGLDFMKENMEAVGNYFNLSNYIDRWLGFYFLIGIVLTVIIQTSSWMKVLTLTALDAWFITLPLWIAIIIGANIGTTSTAIIASMSWRAVEKQVALSHVIFNVLSAIVWFAFFNQFLWVINNLLWYSSNPIMGLAMFDVVFNIATVIIFYPFIGLCEQILKKIVPENPEEIPLKVVKCDETMITTETLSNIYDDLKKIMKHSFAHNAMIFSIDSEALLYKWANLLNLIVHPKKTDDDTIIKKYIKIKTYAEVVISFLLNALRHKQPEAIAKNLQKLSSTTTSILYATKTLKDIKQDIDRVSETEDIFIQNRYQTLRELAIKLYTSISLIIDDKHVNNKKNLEVVAETLSMIEKSEEIFITISSNEIMIWESQENELASLLNITKALYISSKSLVWALKILFLNENEINFFNNFIKQK